MLYLHNKNHKLSIFYQNKFSSPPSDICFSIHLYSDIPIHPNHGANLHLIYQTNSLTILSLLYFLQKLSCFHCRYIYHLFIYCNDTHIHIYPGRILYMYNNKKFYTVWKKEKGRNLFFLIHALVGVTSPRIYCVPATNLRVGLFLFIGPLTNPCLEEIVEYLRGFGTIRCAFKRHVYPGVLSFME